MYIHFVSYVLYLKLTSLFSLKDSYFGFLPRSDKFVFKHIGKVLHCISSLKQWRFIEWGFFQSSFVRTFKFTNLFSLNDSDFCRDLTNFSSYISAMYFLIKNGKVTYFVVSQNLWNFNTHDSYFWLFVVVILFSASQFHQRTYQNARRLIQLLRQESSSQQRRLARKEFSCRVSSQQKAKQNQKSKESKF